VLTQFQKWPQDRLGRPNEEKVEESSELWAMMRKKSVAYSQQFKCWHSQSREAREHDDVRFSSNAVVTSGAE